MVSSVITYGASIGASRFLISRLSLVGDPVLCATRARVRGRYSRFHADNDDANRRELVMYKEAVTFLRCIDYPVRVHDIGSTTADQVADTLTGAILDVRAGQI